MTAGQVSTCRLCRSRELADVLDLGPQPISNRFRASREADEALFPLKVVQCGSCGLTQLLDPPAASELAPPFDWLTYNEPEGHLDRLAEQIQHFLPVGDATAVWGLSFKDDTLLARLQSRGARTYRLDPVADLGIGQPGAGVESIQARIEPSCVPSLIARHARPGMIVARHILEHVHDLHAFLKAIGELLTPGGLLVVEVPDCEPSFRRLDYTIIWEEHVTYHTAATLPKVFDACGMKLLAREVLPLGHESLLIGIGQLADVEPSPAVGEIAEERALVARFGEQFAATRLRFVEKLSEYKRRGERVAVLGAGHLACAFVNFLKLSELIDVVIDDNPRKQGLYLPGSKLPICGSASLLERNVRLCLLSVSPEAEQRVIDRNRAFVANGGQFASIFTASQRSFF